MPIASATVDGYHRKRWNACVDGLGESLFHPARHHSRRVLTLAV